MSTDSYYPWQKKRISDYQAIAQAAAKIWKEHGALEYWECVGDDLNTECTRSFVEMANASDDETVIFAMDQINPIVDFERMAHGGFQEIVRE